MKSVILKVLRQSDLDHNPDPLGQLMWEVRFWCSTIGYFMDMGKKLNLKPKQLQSILKIEGSGGLEVPNLGYMEVCVKIPKVKVFDQDVLLLFIPDSAHTQYTPSIYMDKAIRLATERN